MLFLLKFTISILQVLYFPLRLSIFACIILKTTPLFVRILPIFISTEEVNMNLFSASFPFPLHSVLIWQDGSLLLESYYEPCRREDASFRE